MAKFEVGMLCMIVSEVHLYNKHSCTIECLNEEIIQFQPPDKFLGCRINVAGIGNRHLKGRAAYIGAGYHELIPITPPAHDNKEETSQSRPKQLETC